MSLLERTSGPVSTQVSDIQTELNRYVSRLSATVDLLTGDARPVPKIMHFVWVGGSEVGAIQRDYMNIWRAVLKPQDYRFNLWYDSDALLAFEMNRVILDSARVDAMESGGNNVNSPSELAQMIEDRARVLKHQMFDYLNQPQWAGRSDQARIDLMVRAYGKDRATLEALRQRCLLTHQAMAGADLQLRDVQQEFAGHFLKDVYQREVAMRGNFAAASDVVRLQAEWLEGGRYSDMDYLPPLADKLGGVDISGFNGGERLSVLKLLLDHNDSLMPGRDPQRYIDQTGEVPAQHKEALTEFARRKPRVHEVFVAPQADPVAQEAIRLGTAFSDPIRAEMNAHILAHPRAGMTQAIMEVIRFNYDCLNEVERRMIAAGANWAEYHRLWKIIDDVLKERAAQGGALAHADEIYMARLDLAIRQYYSDGIRPAARGTIVLTGPSAASAGIGKYTAAHLQLAQLHAVRQQLKLTQGYNVFTEEEQITGWTVNGDEDAWLAREQEKWRTGKLKSRYAGQLSDLLKDQTVTFKQGWPVIEGKPVLLTPVLQQLMDELGEPFIRAMNDKLTGDITFHKAVSIGFDSRQQILAQPDIELPISHGAAHTGHLNELFSRIAHGSLPLDQLSPSTRVVLGGIFGATRLDDGGFADTWQNVRNLAIETDSDGMFARYDAIEKAVRQRQSSASGSGPDGHLPVSTQTVRELKVQAMSEALTLRQWSERIGQINRTAQQEFRTQILQRSGQVREAFRRAGAVSARQLPQDLLMRSKAEPGRRCYPLALLMAAAITAGEPAERALVGHMATASVSPQEVGSRALLSAMDELRAVPTSEFGTARGVQGLASIMASLDAIALPAVLLLDTGDHALVLAKVQAGEHVVYRFYDPNFAIYGFADGAQLQLGVEHYLSAGDNTLARLYGLGDVATAQFTVTELNTAAITEYRLSSDLRVDSLLGSIALADPREASVWQKQAQARKRSLGENARMGASLAQLDARYWAGEFDLATRRLRNEHNVAREYSPLLDTLKDTGDGGYSMTLVDSRNPKHSVEVVTRDSRFYNIRKYVERLVRGGAARPGQAADPDGGSRLSFAFAIQTLISEMRRLDYQGADQVPALTVALQVQVYVSYGQLGFGVGSDVVQIVSLVRHVAAGERALKQASLYGGLASKVATVGGVAFSLANIGFDIYNLSLAENHEQRARFSTSLAFNVAALGLDVVALAAGTVVGAAAAALSVPLLGIGIGVTAIASNLGQIMDKAAAIGQHLSELHDAYQLSYESQDNVLQFPPLAVITELNLHSRRVVFDGQKFYPWKGSALELPQYDDDPASRHRAINIPRAFSKPAVARVWGALPEAVILPCSPICYYGYEYQLGSEGAPPFSATRYPQLDDRLANRLEYASDGSRVFYLFSTPFLPHILYKLHPVYMATTIKVHLTEHVRQLVVPDLPQEWQKKIAYHITAPQGQYQIRLSRGLLGVTFDQANGWENVTWTVHAPWAGSEHVSFREKPRDSADGTPHMLVDGVTLNPFDGVIELAEGLFRIDWASRSLQLVGITLDYEKDDEETSDQIRSANSAPAGVPLPVLTYLRAEVKARRLTAAYLPLRRFRVPFNPANRQVCTTAWYDAARDRVLYARDVPKEVNDGLVLAGVSARHAWFYHCDHATVWRVDVLTGTVQHRYRLKNPRKGSTIIGCGQQADGSLRVVQKLAVYGSTTVEYRITGQTVELTACKITFSAEDYRFQPDAALRHIDVPFQDDTPELAASSSQWSCAPFVVVEGYAGAQLQDRAWLNQRTGKRCQAAHNLSWPEDLLMLMPSDPENNAVLFYSQQERSISRGIEPRVGYWENVVIERDVVELTQKDRRYIATKADGRMFEVDIIDVPPAASIPDEVALQYGIPAQANRSDEDWRDQTDKPSLLRFTGIGQRWLRQNPDGWSALAALAKVSKTSPFPILGWKDVAGQAFLAAWCIDEKIALADVGRGKELSLLGLTPDKSAVWLLEVSAGQLYRQPLIAIEALRGAFAADQRLLKPQALAKAEKVWSPWAFTQVQRLGEGLFGQTREGLNLQLLDHQPARIIGIEHHWAYLPAQSAEQLRERLRALLNGHAHAPVLQVASIPGRYMYYVPELDRLFDLPGRSDGQWSVFLGTRGVKPAMLFDPVGQLIFSVGSKEGVWLPESYAHRDAEVLALEVGSDSAQITQLLPDGVDKLLLAFGSQTSAYRISQEAWERLDCIVVDGRRSLDVDALNICTLKLDMDANERLLVSMVDGHLVLVDPDNAHSLIVRDAEPQPGEADLALQIVITLHGKHYSFLIGTWLKALSLAGDDNTLGSLVTAVQKLI
ncbi:MAG TPA: TcdA/TcdB pore-forming domain-containing protein [Pseudomonas sp.]|uniref:TcdA/TcdB pore-forming domain-containing protein n=1 Tax=Pseudomonas sp. TaxID=306 RepID=UPI002CE7C004|nr:TcdA/TcdB pore-forming domain-containing protein [Pseudomonas sp.]HWH90045.1 TcdA/TcdB pore-forming domain-containing protein [Pseudomonas sp.]